MLSSVCLQDLVGSSSMHQQQHLPAGAASFQNSVKHHSIAVLRFHEHLALHAVPLSGIWLSRTPPATCRAVAPLPHCNRLTLFVCPSSSCRLDVPKAPQLLGQLVGSAAAAGALPLSVLPQLLEGAEGAEAKRGFGEAVFKAAAGGLGGEAQLGAACGAAGVKAGVLFAADEFDGDLPSVQDWLKSAGFASVPL
jgi:hypothetical protein